MGNATTAIQDEFPLVWWGYFEKFAALTIHLVSNGAPIGLDNWTGRILSSRPVSTINKLTS